MEVTTRQLEGIGELLSRLLRRPERLHHLVRLAAEQERTVTTRRVLGRELVPLGILMPVERAHVVVRVGEEAIERDAVEHGELAHSPTLGLDCPDVKRDGPTS